MGLSNIRDSPFFVFTLCAKYEKKWSKSLY